MHIEKLKIFNFKRFNGEFELSLNPELNIFVGDNEVGKSSIIEALNLAITGWFKGRYVSNELTQYLFNKEVVQTYLKSIMDGNPISPPNILIEIFLSEDGPQELRGNNNTEKEDLIGFSFKIEFDDRFKVEYEELLKGGSIHSIPIEYYSFHWESFARNERFSPRLLPLKSALIDSSSSRQQNGSDIYIGQIIKNYLETKDVVDVSQAHRKMRDVFTQEEAIKNINSKIQADSKITKRKVELSVELSTKNAWESSLVTYIDEIPFHFLGKGEQCTLKTKLALSNKKTSEAHLLLVEEPENHLSHTKLNELISALKEDGKDKQIIISTHSSFVANKLGLANLILMAPNGTMRLTELDKETYEYFEKLAGYDTLRLLLAKKAILVEGDSDELIVQKAFMMKNKGSLPIENGTDVISVGTSFLRFLKIATMIEKEVVVITDTDWSLESLEKKYEEYIGNKKKSNILISYDSAMDSGELKIGDKPFNYNTLEPKLLKENTLDVLNEIFDTKYEETDDMHRYMKKNKTECSLALFKTDKDFIIPSYIYDVV